MKAFSKRYFVWISLIFLGFSGFSFNSKNLIIFCGILLLFALFCLFLRKRLTKHKNFKVISICLICAAILGVLNTQLLIFGNDKKIEKYCGEHLLRGYVIEISTREEYASEYVVKIEELDGERVNLNILLVADYKAELERGDFFEYSGEVIQSSSYKNSKYLKNSNPYDYHLACVLEEGAYVERLEDEFRIPLMLANLNSKISAKLLVGMGSKNGSLASALLLGNRELLKDQTLRDFKRAGVYHLLALSGLHVTILIGILEWILRKFFVPIKIRIVILGFVSLFYIVLTCFSLSACRSMLMLWIVYISLLLQRQRDVMTSLLVAVCVIVLIKPSAVLDVGLQLSALSTFGVICASIISTKLRLIGVKGEKGIVSFIKSVLRKLGIVAVSSLSVFICSLPVVAICFGEVSLATFVSNFFMGTVCEVFMILSLLMLLFSNVFVICPVFTFLANVVGNLMTFTVERISQADNVMLSLSYPAAKTLVWLLFIGFVFMLAIHLSRRWMIFLPSILFTVCMCVSVLTYNYSREGFVRSEYYFGDGIVLSSNEGVYICDMSDGTYKHLYEGILIAKENCFTEIDGIILTHYHSDHLSALKRITQSFIVRAVYLPMPQNDDEYLRMGAIVDNLALSKIPAYLVNSGEKIDILSGELVLSERAYNANYVHPSVALTYSNGGQRITLIGKPYFNSYLENLGAFSQYISDSDYLIFGSDGRAFKENFEIFKELKEECEVSFAEVETFLFSDYRWYLDNMKIYFDVHYKKYDLK